MRFRLIPCVLAVLVHVLCAAQTPAQPPAPNLALAAKAGRIAMAIGMLRNIKNAVVQVRKGKEAETYNIVSKRLFQCAILYGLLASAPEANPGTAASFTKIADVFIIASPVLSVGGTSEDYKRRISEAQEEILQMRKNDERKATFYVLRNCKDLTEPHLQTVINAITELTLP